MATKTKQKEEIKTVIVDDDATSRKLLQKMLKKYPNINIVGEADNVTSAMDIIKREKPNSLFLDVCLKDESGFDLIKKLKYDPKVVMVSAYDNYAYTAFEYNTLDYIQKPIYKERLDKTINRLYEDIYNVKPNNEIEKQPVESNEKIEDTNDKYADKKNLDYDDRLLISSDGTSRFLKVRSIVCITAEKDYSYIHVVGGKKYIVLKPMIEWERRLTPKHFVRIHRSTIVNLEFVEKAEKWFNYSYHVYLNGMEEPYTMSRRYASKLKERFK